MYDPAAPLQATLPAWLPPLSSSERGAAYCCSQRPIGQSDEANQLTAVVESGGVQPMSGLVSLSLPSLPQANIDDRAHAAARALLGMIPMAGSVATELFTAVVTPSLEKRRAAWFEALAAELAQLKEAVDPHRLIDTPSFTTAFLQASQIAGRTHQAEKLAALRAAVLNVAAGTAPDDDLQLMFFHLVDRFTPTHLAILAFVREPGRHEPTKKWLENVMSTGTNTMIEHRFPELVDRKPFYNLVWRELYQAGLVALDTPNVAVSRASLLNSGTTALGDEFLKFITEPKLT